MRLGNQRCHTLFGNPKALSDLDRLRVVAAPVPCLDRTVRALRCRSGEAKDNLPLCLGRVVLALTTSAVRVDDGRADNAAKRPTMTA